MLEAHLHKSLPLWDDATSRAYSLDDYSLRFLRDTFTGSAQDIDATVDFLDVKSRRRYRRDTQTYCNVYAADVCRVLGAYLPRVWWINAEDASQPQARAVLGESVREMTANAIFDWLAAEGCTFGWRSVSLEEAVCAANRGQIALAVATKQRAHGHISLILPQRTNGRVRQSQAGWKNYLATESLGPWWNSAAFQGHGFWINDLPRAGGSPAGSPGRVERQAFLVGLPARIIYSNSVRHLDRVLTKDLVDERFPPNLIRALILAEDRRYLRHRGFDPIALGRVLWVFLRGKGLQGGSTIEQQLVRTLTGRRERTISRKIREICLSIYCSSILRKDSCAAAYLKVAYFGYGLSGAKAAADKLGYDLDDLSDPQAAVLIAALRYPIPADHGARSLPRQRRAAWIAENLARLRRGSFPD